MACATGLYNSTMVQFRRRSLDVVLGIVYPEPVRRSVRSMSEAIVAPRKPRTPRTIREAVISRRIEIAGQQPRILTIRFAKPKRVEKFTWICFFEIRGLGQRSVLHAYGVDSLQALSLAMERARLWIVEQNISFTGMFEWDPYGIPRQLHFVLGHKENIELAEIIEHDISNYHQAFADRTKAPNVEDVEENSHSD